MVLLEGRFLEVVDRSQVVGAKFNQIYGEQLAS